MIDQVVCLLHINLGQELPWDRQSPSELGTTAARSNTVVHCGAQIFVQVGNLSASLGDRLWASWFSSAAQYARATQPLAAARINVRVCTSLQQACMMRTVTVCSHRYCIIVSCDVHWEWRVNAREFDTSARK